MRTSLSLSFFAKLTVILLGLGNLVAPLEAAPTTTSLAKFTDREPSALMQGRDGNFYGYLSKGANFPAGSFDLFRISPSGTLTTLASFSAEYPANLVEDARGNFYGADNHSIYRFSASGQFQVVADFLQKTPSIYGITSLVVAQDGNLYFTSLGGSFDKGAISRLKPDGTVTLLASFSESDGYEPGSLIQARNGDFYGTTSSVINLEGPPTIFKWTPQGGLKTLLAFESTGRHETSTLVQGVDGNLYGTTGFSFFKLTAAGALTQTETPFYAFGGLVPGGDGNFYSAASGDSGLIARYTSKGMATQVTESAWGTCTSLVLGKDGNLYGSRVNVIDGSFDIFKMNLQLPFLQAITFPKIAPVAVNEKVILRASASSGLPVVYRVVSGPATVLGNRLILTGVGTVKIAANQPGNASYPPAKEVEINLRVLLAAQEMTPFQIIPSQTYPSAPFNIALPVASSGLPVTLRVKSGPATLEGNMLTLTGKGGVTLIATQEGNATFAAARAVATSFSVKLTRP